MTRPITLIAILFHGAIFGFFYAWICSTMWGLDTLPADRAIEAMNAMNASVRNFAFAPAFFGTPFVSGLAAVLCWRAGAPRAAALCGAAAALYAGGAMILTMQINVPMNQALLRVTPEMIANDAAAIWAEYSPRWQFWNSVRTAVSGTALALVAIAYGQLRARA
ncbi:MAG: anthrone oxygenase family protein [Pseudomonadota bacterium]